jgi:hypothetical protein
MKKQSEFIFSFKAEASSRRKLVFPFLVFCFVLSYVGYVPASDDLGIS